MKLTFDEIKSVTFGAQQVVELEDGSIYFQRFSHSQIESLAAMDPTFRDLARSTTGCRLDFHTDSWHILVQPSRPGKYEVLDSPVVTACELTLDFGEFVLPAVRTVEDAGPYKVHYNGLINRNFNTKS